MRLESLTSLTARPGTFTSRPSAGSATTGADSATTPTMDSTDLSSAKAANAVRSPFSGMMARPPVPEQPVVVNSELPLDLCGAADAEPVHGGGWKCAIQAAMALVPLLGMVGCGEAPPPQAGICQPQPLVSEHVAPGDPATEMNLAVDHFDTVGTHCSPRPGIYEYHMMGSDTRLTQDQAREDIKAGKQVFVWDSGSERTYIESPADLQAADALLGRGHNTILPSDQYEALRILDQSSIDGDGLRAGNGRINSYQAYKTLGSGRPVFYHGQGMQRGSYAKIESMDDVVTLHNLLSKGEIPFLAPSQLSALRSLYSGDLPEVYDAARTLHRGQPIQYSFRGGDLDDTLSMHISSSGDLPFADIKVANQKQYDRYRLGAPELKGRLRPQIKRVEEAAWNLGTDAMNRLRAASQLPDMVYTTVRETVTGPYTQYNQATGRYDELYGPHQVENRVLVNNGERQRSMETAQQQMDEVRDLRRHLDNLDREVDRLKDTSDGDLHYLRSLADRLSEATADDGVRESIESVRRTIVRMEGRAPRPAGWVAPEPRVESPASLDAPRGQQASQPSW